MKVHPNLVWIDLEMTGLDLERERIIEIATIVTDSNLNVLSEGPVLAISQGQVFSTRWMNGIKLITRGRGCWIVLKRRE